MRAIDRKMLRDLWHMRGQALAVGLVMACGVAILVMSSTVLSSLEGAREAYYERQRFADVWARLDRAPRALAPRIARLPGVARSETRVVEAVTLDMPGMAEPAFGRLISLPDRGRPELNDLHLRSGRWLAEHARREVLLGEAFAEAHGLHPGDEIDVVMNGSLASVAIAGIVLSPEYTYQIRDGDVLPDHKRYAVMWMAERELAAAFDMEGAFNDVAVRLERGAREEEVIDGLDALLEPYGCLGAYARKDQTSNHFLSSEITGLRVMIVVIPAIFLSVAAFLFNVVISRLVGTQREQIAALKALGYGGGSIALHYLELVLLIAAFAVVVGTATGAWLGSGLTEMYARFYRFPVFAYALEAPVVVQACAVAAAAAIAGAVGSVRAAAKLPPAEAMRPEPPASFRPTVLERVGFERILSPAARMILRQIERRPRRAAISCIGMALATAVLVVGGFMGDAIDYAMEIDFEASQRQEVLVTFIDPASRSALHELAHLPGVRRCEPMRVVAARLRYGHRERRTAVNGLDPAGDLFRVVATAGQHVELPPRGLLLSRKLAEVLGAEVGDSVTVEVLQDQRPVRDVPVVALGDDRIGLSAYMSIDAVHDLMGEGGAISGAYVSAFRDRIDELNAILKETPRVASVAVKANVLQSFRDTVAENMLRMRFFNLLFAVIIACGVVYNTARISLSERSRELATLRVIGFTRAEASMIQLGELAALTAVAIPIGLVLGYGLAWVATIAYDMELFRVPLHIDAPTYGLAAAVVIVAATLSGLVVRRMIDRLDLIAVLKTKE
jgi:putative ABC transport system permease protein